GRHPGTSASASAAVTYGAVRTAAHARPIAGTFSGDSGINQGSAGDGGAGRGVRGNLDRANELTGIDRQPPILTAACGLALPAKPQAAKQEPCVRPASRP